MVLLHVQVLDDGLHCFPLLARMLLRMRDLLRP